MMKYAATLIVGTALATSVQAQTSATGPVPASPAQAAADAPTTASAPQEGLGDIVVTAQRRVENLQKVAISATVLDTTELANKSVTSLNDLQLATPSLSITDGGIFQNVNIRGIGIATNSAKVTPGVSTYIDGLIQAPIVTSNLFYDLASVEVLRGPQGTLVGTNSTGGAIYINSKNPDLAGIGGYGTASYATHNTFEGEGALNLPFSDTLAVRGTGFYRHHDSYYNDAGPYHNSAGRLDEEGGRFSLLWKPGSFQALLKVQYNDRQTGGYAYRPILGTPFAAYRVGDDRTLSYDAPTANRDRLFLTSLELREELASGIVLRSLAGYQRQRVDNLYDVDGSQAPAAAGGTDSEVYFAGGRTYSEEINIISPTGRAFSWLLGGYFQRDDVDVMINELKAGFRTDITPGSRRTTLGAFGQGDYHITPALELQLGARYSHSTQSGVGAVAVGRGLPVFPPAGLVVSNLSGGEKDGRVTGKAALNYTVDDSLFYAFYARGYKPGGFNSATSFFVPETVDSYEIGWKASLLGRHLRTQISAFYNRYFNFQYNVVDPTSGVVGVQNIANLTIKGIEAQAEGRFGRLRLDGSIAFVASHVPNFTLINSRNLPSGTLGPQCAVGVASHPPVCFDYAPYKVTAGGGSNVYAPRWTYDIGASYELPLGGVMTLTPRVNYGYVSSQYTYLAYNPISDVIAGRGLVSAQLTLRTSRWWLEAYGTNLTNRTYVSGQFGNNELYGAPREAGVRVGLNF